MLINKSMINILFFLIFLYKFLLQKLYYRISAIILLFPALLINNLLNIYLVTGIGIYNGLFHINLIIDRLDFFAILSNKTRNTLTRSGNFKYYALNFVDT